MDVNTDQASICLWFERDAEGAARFYADTFGGEVLAVYTAKADYPDGKAGDPLTVTLRMLGMSFVLLNGGPRFTPNESFSLQVHTDDQEETDRLWDAIVGNGGEESVCGWCRDRWGYSWQITPRALTNGMADPDPEAGRRVMEAMMQMGKIDIAAIEAARAGAAPAA